MESNFASDLKRRRLTRSHDDRMVAGVAGGVAQYLDLDPTVVHVGAALLALAGGIGVPLYLAAWALVPDESGRSIADELIDRVERA